MVSNGETTDGAQARGSFGALLRRLRHDAGLTQEELAARAGLTPNAVSALERGARRRPYPHTVRSLAEALGLPEGERAALLAAMPGRGGPAAGNAAAPEATAAGAAPASRLPHPPTSLVGRGQDLGQVGGLLARRDVRLLTLTGIGGVGKTRLAAQDFSDGAAFVGLAALADPALVLPTIAQALGLVEAEGRGPGDVLRAYLGERKLLLVLDI